MLIVDDGIATGYTVMSAAQAILEKDPEELIIAVPVAPRESVSELQQSTGLNVVALSTPTIIVEEGQ